MLKGMIYITGDIEVIRNSLVGPMNKIISLDEDHTLGDNKDIIGGLCLLPPMEAKIAEADGNELMYDNIYRNHLLEPTQQEFISALLAFLYKGGNLILYLPEIGYTNTVEKLIQHLYIIYGIHPGIIGDPNPMNASCYYDTKCIPIWLNMIFIAGVITPVEFLFMYPEEAVINNQMVMNILIKLINPYGSTLAEKENYIAHYHKIIHKNPKVIPAIQSL